MPSGLHREAQPRGARYHASSMSPGFRKSPRMPGFDYRGSLVAHVTIVTRLRQHIFTDDNLAQKCLDALNESAQRFDATLHAYCLMPDHLHLLVYVDAEATLKQFVHHFKTISSFRIKQETGQSPWQTSYHEHPASRRQHQRSPGLYLEQTRWRKAWRKRGMLIPIPARGKTVDNPLDARLRLACASLKACSYKDWPAVIGFTPLARSSSLPSPGCLR
jgi:REP element-mobilizing transposase RayT